MSGPVPEHWLDWYGGHRYDWQRIPHGEDISFARRLGIVESFFDHDGHQLVGRADVTALLTLEVRSRLGAEHFRHHVTLAWAVLRARHALLRARAVEAEDNEGLYDVSLTGRCFVVEQAKASAALLEEAHTTLSFLQEHGYEGVDVEKFYRHTMNTARCFRAEESLSHLYVLPLQKQRDGKLLMHTVMVFAHQITDGLSANATNAEFIDLLNHEDERLLSDLEGCCAPAYLQSILPPAQEALYQPLAYNPARSRWHWAISRVLRHKRKPPLEAFKNPLKRAEALPEIPSMPATYDNVLDYSIKPPINTFVGIVVLPPATTKRIVGLCKEAKASVGSGLFALVGLAMMTLEEEWHPSVPLHERPAFVASFPLNIRPFLNYNKPPDSIMLSFSDGLSFPFLPSYLPAEGRFKLLARQAHKQLRMYQKGVRSAKEDALLGSRSPAQVVPIGYLSQIERFGSKIHSAGRSNLNPQGELAVPSSSTGATNGVSSVGNRSTIISAGKHALDGTQDFAADFRDLVCAPRAREGEFLCAAQGDGDVLRFHVAYDANSVDETKFEAWRHKMLTLLMYEVAAKL